MGRAPGFGGKASWLGVGRGIGCLLRLGRGCVEAPCGARYPYLQLSAQATTRPARCFCGGDFIFREGVLDSLGTPYPEVARHVFRLMHTPPLQDNAVLAVDATGVGRAVVDQLKAHGLSFKSVVITAGHKESRDGDIYRVPKRDLIARPQVLLQEGNRRLKIAPSLPEAGTLVEELLNFCHKISDAGNDTYGAWREGQHDDLLLALCLAVWAADRRSPPVDETLVSTSGPFSISEQDLYTYDDNDLFW